jgi:hypothetical protein
MFSMVASCNFEQPFETRLVPSGNQLDHGAGARFARKFTQYFRHVREKRAVSLAEDPA